jgi:alpha-1,3-rhamnosyl/mannosyltransferase
MKIILGTDSLSSPLAGIGNYTLNLARGLLSDQQIEEVCGLNHKGFSTQESLKKNVSDKNGRVRPEAKRSIHEIKKAIRKVPGAYYLRNIFTDILSNKYIKKKYKNFIYHETNYILKNFDFPSIATIHDLSHIHYPSYHPKERVRYINDNLSKTIENSEHIITVSDFVRDEIVNVLGVDGSKITVVPNGVDPKFKPRQVVDLAFWQAKYKLDRPYILSVGTLEPRKNIDTLLDAYMRLPQHVRQSLPLVLVGGKGWCYENLNKKIELLEKKGELRYLGYVPAEDLPYLFSGASLFVFPSFYEGFGLPPLEAMASGVPVIVSKSSAMAEVVDHAGRLFDPFNTDELLAALVEVIEDRALREEMIRHGLVRAAQYSWDSCVRSTIDVYAKVAGEKGVV